VSTYIIAEAGVNHNGSLELAKELVRVASECGADAVKFQTFKTNKLVTKTAKKAAYQNENEKETSSQEEMLKRLELSDENFLELRHECEKNNIEFMTTCFDSDSLRVICEQTNPKVLKVGSGDLTNLPLVIEHARTGRDIIISTGMATLSEVEDALAALAFGYLCTEAEPESYDFLKLNYFTAESLSQIRNKVTILHCVTDYPAQPEDLNLDALRQLAQAYQIKVGYSDHSLGMEACCAAVALGATCLEKHITLDKKMPGPDHSASASPEEFKQLVAAIRNLEKALVPKIKAPTKRERANLEVARKYIVAAKDISKGDMLASEMIEIKRSSYGLHPKCYWDVVGSIAEKDYKQGDSI